MPFSPYYASHILAEHFAHARRAYAAPLLAIHRAHLVMLARQGLLSASDAHALRLAIDAAEPIVLAPGGSGEVDAASEDFFFFVEGLLREQCGEDTSGRLHVARSRNDIDMTMYRMVQRESILQAIDADERLRRTLIGIADRHVNTVLPLHTHTQPAQPGTLAHYLLASVEQLERDDTRLRAAFATTNRCPLGACAITGTGFEIDRQLTSDLLGFDRPTGNTYGSIATCDYVLEGAGAVMVTVDGVGRLLHDLLLWSMSEFGYLTLAEGFVQQSSIMPQKRNPVALEHARAIASRSLGRGQAVFVAVHNTPFGDIVDTEDDLQPMVAAVFEDAITAMWLTAEALDHAVFHVDRLERSAGTGWITLTELADVLVRERGVSFRRAHAVAAAMLRAHDAKPDEPLSVALARASEDVLGVSIELSDERLGEVLSPRTFVERRRTPGGPAPESVIPALAAARERVSNDAECTASARARLRRAAVKLGEQAQAL